MNLRIILIPALLTLSCGGPATDAVESNASPDDGVPTVFVPALALAESPELVLEEEVVVHGDGREPTLSGVPSLALDPDGGIYFLDRFDPIVRSVAADGTLRFAVGRVGDGPGELRRARLVAVGGDTVFVLDDRELEMFGIDGRHLETVRIESPLWPRVRAIKHTDAGLIVATGNTTPAYERLDSTTFRRLDPSTGAIGDPILQLPGRQMYQVTVGTFVGSPSHGESRWSVTRGRILTSGGQVLEIDVLSLDGALRQRLRSDLARRPIPRAEADSTVNNLRTRQDTSASGVAGGLDDFPHPDFRPLLGPIFGADDGAIVMRIDGDVTDRQSPLRGLATWLLITADGRAGGRFPDPERFVPFVFQDCSLVGVRTDALGVPSVVRFRLRNPAATQPDPCS